MQTTCIGNMVAYFAAGQTDTSQSDALIYATGIVACTFLHIVTYHPFKIWCYSIALKYRMACAGLVYQKTLRLRQELINDGLSGRILSILAIDLSRAELGIASFARIVEGPLDCLIYGYIIYSETGFVSIVGIFLLMAFVPLQSEYWRQSFCQQRFCTTQFHQLFISSMDEQKGMLTILANHLA